MPNNNHFKFQWTKYSNQKTKGGQMKKHQIATTTTKQDPYIWCPQETHFRSKYTQRLKVMEEKYSMQMETKSRGRNTHIRQNRL